MPQPFTRLVIAGMPRCGTTLLATFLNAQNGITFMTDYVRSFHEAMERLDVDWHESLSLAQRRVVLAIVRDQFLRFRHPVLSSVDDFRSIDDLHRLVLDELRAPGDSVVGHKVRLDPQEVEYLLDATPLYCVVLLRDPRDAALSWFHRAGKDVEFYLRDWKRMVRTCHRRQDHPRLFALRYESLVTRPQETLSSLARALAFDLDTSIGSLSFQRAPTTPRTGWTDNSSYGDVKRPFDHAAVGRWRADADSEVVRYAAWLCRREVVLLGYDPSAKTAGGWRERFHFRRAATIAEAAFWADTVKRRSSRFLRRSVTFAISDRRTPS